MLRRDRFGLVKPADFGLRFERAIAAEKGSNSSSLGVLFCNWFLVTSLNWDDTAVLLGLR